VREREREKMEGAPRKKEPLFSLEINESPGTRGDILKGKHSAKKKKSRRNDSLLQ
jgi:hypothetical protein